jgi:RecA/RadA recombinase
VSRPRASGKTILVYHVIAEAQRRGGICTLNRTDTICIFRNQLRETIGVMFGNPETTPSGDGHYLRHEDALRRTLSLRAVWGLVLMPTCAREDGSGLSAARKLSGPRKRAAL